jgi:hypothetical protein
LLNHTGHTADHPFRMSLPTHVLPRRRSRTVLVAGVLLLGALAAACTPAPPPPGPGEVCDPPAASAPTAVAVMGRCPRVSVDQIVAWFDSYPGRPAYRASVPIRDLVTRYVEEANAEGVRGDIAFVQAIVESGWFSFPGRIPPSANNFSGYGATDGTTDYGVFPDARTGVRVHIQHLRAYADPTFVCASPPLANPCITPRSVWVTPKGKAPTWNQFGNGVWASDPTYAPKILDLYAKLLTKYGLTLA